MQRTNKASRGSSTPAVLPVCMHHAGCMSCMPTYCKHMHGTVAKPTTQQRASGGLHDTRMRALVHRYHAQQHCTLQPPHPLTCSSGGCATGWLADVSGSCAKIAHPLAGSATTHYTAYQTQRIKHSVATTGPQENWAAGQERARHTGKQAGEGRGSSPHQAEQQGKYAAQKKSKQHQD